MDTTSSLIALAAILITSTLLMVVEWAWLKPKRLEKRLRQHGFSGNPYRLYYGDSKDRAAYQTLAASKPIDAGDQHQVVLRMRGYEHHILSKYGRKCFMWQGPEPLIMVTDPKLIKEIFIKNDIFHKPKNNPFFSLLLTGSFSYEGEQWHKVRRIVNPAFHLNKLKDMFPNVYSSCTDTITKWKMHLDSNRNEIDAWSDIKMMASDVISRTAFGSSYEEGRKIFELLTEQAHNLTECLRFSIIPKWRFMPTALNRRMKKNYNQTRGLIKGLIEKRERAIRLGEENSDDLLGMLIESSHREIKEQGHKKGSGLTTEEVIEECKQFYIAGQETTASLITWAMVLLSVHQNWQKLAREEVLQVFKNNKPKFDYLNSLKVVTKIIYETLRLYPPANVLYRSICSKTKLGDLEVGPEMMILIPVILIHYDREYWGEDAGEFNPDRFSEGISKAAKTSEVPYFPFGGGPRICIGQNFALVEAKLALAMILQNFSFNLSPNYTHTPTAGVITCPLSSVPFIFDKI